MRQANGIVGLAARSRSASADKCADEAARVAEGEVIVAVAEEGDAIDGDGDIIDGDGDAMDAGDGDAMDAGEGDAILAEVMCCAKVSSASRRSGKSDRSSGGVAEARAVRAAGRLRTGMPRAAADALGDKDGVAWGATSGVSVGVLVVGRGGWWWC